MIVRSPHATVALAAVAFVSACSFSPINHRIKIGEESFIVFVGEGIDHNTDLFAVPANGGSVAQITFTPLVEKGPRLSPTGEVVAFLRMRDTIPGTPRNVVLMNLLSGGEAAVALPADAGAPHSGRLVARCEHALHPHRPGRLADHHATSGTPGHASVRRPVPRRGFGVSTLAWRTPLRARDRLRRRRTLHRRPQGRPPLRSPRRGAIHFAGDPIRLPGLRHREW